MSSRPAMTLATRRCVIAPAAIHVAVAVAKVSATARSSAA